MNLYLAPFILPISSSPFEKGGILVEKGKIQDIGDREVLLKRYPQAEIHELERCAFLPGLIQAHAHLELQQTPLQASPSLIETVIGLSKSQDALSAERKRDAIQQGLSRLFQDGVTTLGDVTTYEGGIPVYQESNLRVVIFPEIMNLNRSLSQDRFELALALIDEIQESNSSKTFAGLALFAPYTLSKNLLKILAQHLKHSRIPVQIHAALSFAEMEFFFDSTGEIATTLFPHLGWAEKIPPPYHKTPIQYLESIGFLETEPTLVGCIHTAPIDLDIIQRTRSTIILTPSAYPHLQLGQAPYQKILERQIGIGLGQEPSGTSFPSFWETLRALYRSRSPRDTLLSAREILKMATLSGAKALKLDRQIGSLEQGKWADFLAVAIEPETSLENLEERILTQTDSGKIRKRFVAGQERKP